MQYISALCAIPIFGLALCFNMNAVHVCNFVDNIRDIADEVYDIIHQLDELAERIDQQQSDIESVAEEIFNVEIMHTLEKVLSEIDNISHMSKHHAELLLDAIKTVQRTSEQTVQTLTKSSVLINDAINQKTLQVLSKINGAQSAADVGFKEIQASCGTILSAIDHLEISNVTPYGGQESAIDSLKQCIIDGFHTVEQEHVVIMSVLDQIHSLLPISDSHTTPCATGEIHTIEQTDIGAGDEYIITTPGYYRLAESITFNHGIAITIQASNVTLDLHGNCIDGSSAGSYGICIAMSDVSNVVIENGLLCGAQGISMHNTHAPCIQNIRAYNNVLYGIKAIFTDKLSLFNCNVSYVVNGNGIELQSCANVVIQSSSLQGNSGHGILCMGSACVYISDCVFQSNQANGMLIDVLCSGIQVIGNRIMSNKEIGMEDQGAADANYANNLSSGNRVAYAGVMSVPMNGATSYWKNVRA